MGDRRFFPLAEEDDETAEPVTGRTDDVDDVGETVQPVPRAVLVIGGLAALIILLILILLISALTGGSSHKPAAQGGGAGPADTVRTYLAALSRADASAALAVSAPPPATTYLTDAALRVQQQQAPLSSVDVSGGDASGSTATVSAHYRFGSRAVSTSIYLTKKDGAWRVDPAVITYNLPELGHTPAPTLFGIPVTGDTVYAFPGPAVFGTADPDYGVTTDGSDWPTGPTTTTASTSLTTTLSDAGKLRVDQAVAAGLVPCIQSSDLEPSGCPQQEYDVQGVAHSARWQLNSDLEKLDLSIDSDRPTTIDVSGDTTWDVDYTSRDFDGTTHARHERLTVDIDGTVDLTAATPRFHAS